MRKHFLWISCAILILSVTFISWKPANGSASTTVVKAAPSANNLFSKYVEGIYQATQLQASGLTETVFQKAVTGFINLKLADKLPQNSSVITIVDFDKPSHEKRMWIIDLVNKHLLLNTWVAHGQGSGDDMATKFSNLDNSHQSSLGFYVTDDIYYGKHGRSLHLDGLDTGFNDDARAREIVVHAADYVSQNTIDKLGRLGRSWGCPAVSPDVAGQVIDYIKGKTMLFINGDDSAYTSKYLNEGAVANYISKDTALYKPIALL